MGDLTKNFSRSEFACKCGCGKDHIDARVVNMCQIIRDKMNMAVTVGSGVRCVKRNAAVGGVDGSFHTKGTAADLSCAAGAEKLFLCIVNLYAAGKLPDLKYCIWYKKKNFVHIDCGKDRSVIFAIN